MNKNKSLIHGVLALIISQVIYYILYQLKFEVNWWNHSEAIYFVPIWSVGLAIVAYGFSQKFYKRKVIHFPKERPSSYNLQEAIKQWKWEKMHMVYKTCKIGRTLLAIAVPIYVLAYIDKSDYLTSNWYIISFFIISTLVCLILELYYKRRLNL